ncbi:MAG: alpha/beta hydrolase [Acidobacteriota bacterium]|jgi:alpha/beta superfamily hydrolase|nr:alpha/beta hydrolase [Acidobacteriota bacterium]
MPPVTDLAGPAGPLEALLDRPGAEVRAAVVFAHPHPQFGGTMHTKAVFQGAKGLTRLGCAVLRFNFRGVGRSAGAFGEGEGEKADFRAGLDYMAARYPAVSLWAAGFSFGAWVALEVGADDDRVAALIGIAPPVATTVSGQVYTFERTLASTKPKFFVQGEADEVCPIESMWAFYGKLEEPKELVVVDMANHLFEGQTAEVGEALEDLLADFDPLEKPVTE